MSAVYVSKNKVTKKSVIIAIEHEKSIQSIRGFLTACFGTWVRTIAVLLFHPVRNVLSRMYVSIIERKFNCLSKGHFDREMCFIQAVETGLLVHSGATTVR